MNRTDRGRYFIYMIFNTITDLLYVGLTSTSLMQRMTEHRRAAERWLKWTETGDLKFLYNQIPNQIEQAMAEFYVHPFYMILLETGAGKIEGRFREHWWTQIPEGATL